MVLESGAISASSAGAVDTTVPSTAATTGDGGAIGRPAASFAATAGFNVRRHLGVF